VQAAASDDLVGRVEQLLDELESVADPATGARATELLQALLDLYGEGLARVVARVGEEQALALVDDELVAHLLLLHDLHPVPLEERVREGLEAVRPYLESHGGGVQLLGVEEGVARLRLHGSCEGCPSSAMTLKLAIEDALQRTAPDLERVEAEGAVEPAPQPLLQLEIAQRPDPDGTWAIVGTLAELAGGGTVVKRVAEQPLLFLRLERACYAYHPTCSGCGESLEDATLQGAELVCAGCERRYDVRRAGRCLDEPDTWLEPVPLLTDDAGLVKVALGTAVA
jgi:Fe-S cluster biogenesis protein NfuA/nitrite reductase/ring-hydroxylating ferredoxin subunit